MRRFDTLTLDPAGLVFLVMVVLLMVGTIPFTPLWVGIVLIVSQIHLSFTYALR